MTNAPSLVTGLHEIADRHDALICDVWGVLHNGTQAHMGAVDALQRFRADFGPVVLLSNAPRPASVLEEQFRHFGVPPDCYDAIMTSGIATREALAERAHGGRLAIFHLGPERDRGIFEGLPIDCVEMRDASLVMCSGLFDDETETPETYRAMLLDFKALQLPLLCANPDIVVQRGGKLIYCAGAIARLYEQIGGTAIYYGKPHVPIYRPVLAAARRAAGRDVLRPLAIGDGLETDIRGANNAAIEALFIANGIHGEEIGEFTRDALADLFARAGVGAEAAMRALVW
jgi:HAD superfamily hydrolase (TIGR01459 family)